MKNPQYIIAPLCGIAVALAVFGAVKFFEQIPPAPTPPPVAQTVPTEEEAIVEVHRALEHAKPAPQRTTDEYLCDVYKRTPVKHDGSDFTWKDIEAARRKGMDVCAYVIGGMAPELKTRLVKFGAAADGKGLNWSMLAGFRDDYRQSIATGFKARTGYSQHGGSKVTKGYGDGRAIDITAVGPVKPILALIDSIGRELGLIRPYKGKDPNHVQLSRPTQFAAKSVKPQRVAKVKVKKHKVRYAKRIKHRTRVATRQNNADFFPFFDFADRSGTVPRHRGKVQRPRRT